MITVITATRVGKTVEISDFHTSKQTRKKKKNEAREAAEQ